MSWMDLFKGRSLAAPGHMPRLDHYPPYQAPFPGPPLALTVQQAQANLDYLLAKRAERLAIITELLLGVGVDPRPALRGEDFEAFLKDTKAWVLKEWPRLYDRKIATLDVWLATSRTGKEIVYSMLMDVSILFAEIVIVRRPEYVWSLDLDKEKGRDEMLSYKRPVLQVSPDGTYPVRALYDVERVIFGQYHRGHLNPVVYKGMYEFDYLVREPVARQFP